MKKLSESRTLALTALVMIALLAVPLFGGLGLKTAQNRAAKAFSAIACNTDQHGNDLFSDADRLIAAASSLLEEGKASASEEKRRPVLRGILLYPHRRGGHPRHRGGGGGAAHAPCGEASEGADSQRVRPDL